MSKHQLLKSYKPQKSNSTDKKNRKKNKKHIVTLLHLNSSTDSLVTNCPSLWTLGQDKHLSFYFEHYSKWSVNHNQYLRSNCPSTLIGRALFSVNSCYAVITLSKAKFLCGQISDRVYAAKQIDIQIKGNQHLAGITIFYLWKKICFSVCPLELGLSWCWQWEIEN